MINELKTLYDLFYYKIWYNTCNYFNIDKQNLYENIYNYISKKGPVFIKIGQILSSKTFIDPLLRNKLKRLKNRSDNTDEKTYFEKLKISNIVTIFPIPFACGSITKLYKCIYIKNGKNVLSVLKVCIVDIDKKIKRDIKLIKKLLTFGSYFFKDILMLKNGIIWDSYFQELIDQCDLRNEVFNIRKFQRLTTLHNLNHLIHLPTIHRFNTDYILESYEQGENIETFVKKHKSKTFETISLLTNVFQISLTQQWNFFHSDMHTSNYMFSLNEKKNVILTLIDFGLVSKLNNKFSKNLENSFDKIKFKINIDSLLNCIFSEMRRYNSNEKVEKFIDKLIETRNYNNNVEIPHMYFEENSKFINCFNILNYTQDVLNIIDTAFYYNIKIDSIIVNLFQNLLLLDEIRLKYIKGKPIELMDNKLIAKIGNQDPFFKFWEFNKRYSIIKFNNR